MDHRLYFVLGDLVINVLTGAIVGWLTWLAIDTDWNMWVAMIAAMLVGMAIAIPLWLPAGILFGAMEAMLPMMLTGMLSGMVVGMRAAMHVLPVGDALFTGGCCGLAAIVAVWITNNQLRGVTKYG